MTRVQPEGGGWKGDLSAFFEVRSRDVIGGRLSDAELCWVSGREPRLWSDPALYADLITSVVDDLDLRADQHLLEMGCAAGFLARGLAGQVSGYVGVDLSWTAARAARSLRLGNAVFVQGDGTALPFGAAAFDRVAAYDVFTNFADWTTAEAVVAEMVRVVRPGGRVMIGSLGDEATREEFERVAQEVSRNLDARYGPLQASPPPSLLRRLWRWWRPEPPGRIVCYFFKRRDFLDLGTRLGVDVRVTELHVRNPYRGYRFNVVYTKPTG
jgi:SAM-dependent methyltransferase